MKFQKGHFNSKFILGSRCNHGCAIIQNDKPLIYMEDVGRHNAVDKIAGYMFLKK